MYESFYKLRELPFTLTPDPAFLYYSPQHRFALTMLRYGLLSRAGFSVLTGEVGSGKTLLVRQLLASLEGDVTIGLISNTSRHLGRLLQWVCLAYGIEHAGQDDPTLYQAFVDFLVREYAAGRQVVLIVDEAQNLGIDMLEQLRVLSNVNADKNAVLQTILVGQPELLETLKLPNLRQFAQRVAVDYHLGPMTRDDVHGYVRHRLTVAGGSPDLFAPLAIDFAHAAAGGVPRLVNQLCDTALVYAFADQLTYVDGSLMQQVIASRLGGGIFPGQLPPEMPLPVARAGSP